MFTMGECVGATLLVYSFIAAGDNMKDEDHHLTACCLLAACTADADRQ